MFFKGCPLKCLWCSNPEGQSGKPELMFFNQLCSKSNNCVNSCTHNAVIKSSDGFPEINRELCGKCKTNACVAACYSGALKISGEYKTADEIINRIKPNIPFYKNSGGGVTFSGGEPLQQPLFAEKLLSMCKENIISVGLETSGYFNFVKVKDFIGEFDFIYYDIKSMNDSLHNKVTGKSNKIILENLKQLAVNNKEKIIITIPLIPGINSSDHSVNETLSFCKSIGITRMRVLPYHPYGREKYSALNKEYLL